MKKILKNKGYTLLELLIVISIIGVISAIGLPVYNEYSKKTKINASLANHQNYFKSLNARVISCQNNKNINITLQTYPGFINCSKNRGYIGDSIAFTTMKEAEERSRNPYNNQPSSSTTYWGNGREPSDPPLGYLAFGYIHSSNCRPGGITGQLIVIKTNIGNINGSNEIVRNEICTSRI